MTTCNYIEYQRMTNSLFFGVALTDKHMNEATEHIRRYFINGGALEIVNALGIGIKVTEKRGFNQPPEIIEQRFIYLSGENAGRELTVNEICSIGMFLRGGPYYGKIGK